MWAPAALPAATATKTNPKYSPPLGAASYMDKPQNAQPVEFGVANASLVVLGAHGPALRSRLRATRHRDTTRHFIRRMIGVPLGRTQAVYPDRSSELLAPLQRSFVAWVRLNRGCSGLR
jgi:hypothetical protein